MIVINFEYDWDVEGNYVWVVLVDCKVGGIFDEVRIVYLERMIIVYEGDENQWMVKWVIKVGQSFFDLVVKIDVEIYCKMDWKLKDSQKGDRISVSKWFLMDEVEELWVLFVKVEQYMDKEMGIIYYLERVRNCVKQLLLQIVVMGKG